MKLLLLATAALLAALPAAAQTAVGANQPDAFKDTSILKPPAGQKVALIEFEDLECPACAGAAPAVRAAVEHYHIPYLHHDFIIPNHIWSRDGAITARYLQDKVSPQAAEFFRHDVFAAQSRIGSKDDLNNFTRKWFQQHNIALPFLMDPVFSKEVTADDALGNRLGVVYTPTIVVVTANHWIEVKDSTQLYAAIDQAESEASASTPSPAHNNIRKSATLAK